MTKKYASMIHVDFFKGIAHRGLHNKEFTENGLNAFQNAIDHHIAFELDIHLTKDGQLLVCHDSNLKRTTGKDGIIEDLTLAEIRENYHLLDGEKVPTFQEVLDLNKEKEPIVVELKVYQANYRPLAKAATQVLSSIKDPHKIILISFDPRALLAMKKGRFARMLLVCKEKEWTWHLRGFFEGVDLEKTMIPEKRVQRYFHRGGLVNVWTIESKDELTAVRQLSDTVTFQNFAVEDIIESYRNVK